MIPIEIPPSSVNAPESWIGSRNVSDRTMQAQTRAFADADRIRSDRSFSGRVPRALATSGPIVMPTPISDAQNRAVEGAHP